jgi:hypothetical protein
LAYSITKKKIPFAVLNGKQYKPPAKLREEHITKVKEFLELNQNNKVTISKVRHHLLQYFPALVPLAHSTLLHCLHKDLKYSFKRINLKPAPAK